MLSIHLKCQCYLFHFGITSIYHSEQFVHQSKNFYCNFHFCMMKLRNLNGIWCPHCFVIWCPGSLIIRLPRSVVVVVWARRFSKWCSFDAYVEHYGCKIWNTNLNKKKTAVGQSYVYFLHQKDVSSMLILFLSPMNLGIRRVVGNIRLACCNILKMYWKPFFFRSLVFLLKFDQWFLPISRTTSTQGCAEGVLRFCVSSSFNTNCTYFWR